MSGKKALAIAFVGFLLLLAWRESLHSTVGLSTVATAVLVSTGVVLVAAVAVVHARD